MNNNARLDYVDFAKGFGMLAVIWGHIMDVGWSHSIVYGFHMPLFFFLSGMMFRKERFQSFSFFLKRRFKSLIKPYLVISFVTWVIWVIYNSFSHNNVDSYIMPLLQTFIAQGPGNYLTHNAPLWFISCLFFVEIIYFFICKTKSIVFIVACLLCALLGWAMEQPNNFYDLSKLPWNMDYGLSVLPFYALGNVLVGKIGHQSIIEYVKQRQLMSITTVVFLSILMAFCANHYGFISIGSSLRKCVILPYAIAICGIVATMLLSVTICNSCVKKCLQLTVEPVLWIGQNCIFFLAFHCPIKGFIIILIAKIFKLSGPRAVQTCMGYSFIAFVISLVVTAVVVFVVDKMIARYKSNKEPVAKSA